MRLFDLSFRYKIPLWGCMLILLTAGVISLSFGIETYRGLQHDMTTSSIALGRTLAKTIYPALVHDDIWHAFELVNAPYRDATNDNLEFQAEIVIVFNERKQVFVSNHPDNYPLLAEMGQLGSVFPKLAEALANARDDTPIILEQPDTSIVLLAIPIISDDVMLGSLVMVLSTSKLWPRFLSMVQRAAFITLLVLAVLLPINWYWGQRMAVPLMMLAQRFGTMRKHLPEEIEPNLYAYNDELGRLFKAFSVMLGELREKEAMERQMIQSERMAIIGRLTAGIAHEINNPLGGMLNAIDTLKHHGSPDRLTERTISLLERGLQQVRETVATLLVQTKTKSRNLTPQDVDDVLTLIMPQAEKNGLHIETRNNMGGELAVPSTLVRQIMINLLINAVQAAGELGRVVLEIVDIPGQLRITVSNDGKEIAPDQMKYLFEPFNPLSESGHGLGLWVTYQIVQQLGGQISATSQDGITQFVVVIPMESQS